MPTYCVSGIFAPGRGQPADLQREEQAFSEHLAQSVFRVHLAGPLFDRAGAPSGWLIVVDAPSFDEAQAYLARSPYYALYATTAVFAFHPEVGKLN